MSLRTPTAGESPRPIETQIATARPSATPSPTPIPSATPTLVFPTPTWSEPLVFIDAPAGPLSQPYIVITAYDPNIGYAITQIRGLVDQNEFTCLGDRCSLPIEGDSVVLVWARSSSGQTSESTSATVRIQRDGENYYVDVEALKPIHFFVDTCAEIWELEGAPYLRWTLLPQSPMQLHTGKNLHYLAKQILTSGIVEASDCPGAGLDQTGAPNACGLDSARTQTIHWQNQFDFTFWLVGKESGIPPILLKSLADYETQFWPESARYFMDEYGLTQVNELGVDVILRWDLDFYQQICRMVTADCAKSYYRQPEQIQRMMRGAALQALNADCPSCDFGLDLVKTRQSIETIALILRANCSDVQYILETYTYNATYEDSWRFTLVAYHSGINCLEEAVRQVVRTGWDINWTQVAEKLACPGAADYANQVWAYLANFQDNLLQPGDPSIKQVLPTLLPSRTPLPSPTAVVSYAQVRVQVFIDVNNDGLPQQGEWLDQVDVQLELSNGKLYTGLTENGIVVFDLTGEPIGVGVTASLPGLYKSDYFYLPAAGQVLVNFIFPEPVVPLDLP